MGNGRHYEGFCLNAHGILENECDCIEKILALKGGLVLLGNYSIHIANDFKRGIEISKYEKEKVDQIYIMTSGIFSLACLHNIQFSHV